MNTSQNKPPRIHGPADRPQVDRVRPQTPGAAPGKVRIFNDSQAADTAAAGERDANSAEQMHARQVAEAAEQTATAEAAVHQSAEWKAFMLAQENERRLKAAGLKS